jgi:RNA 2',3'-cyclic 3'-phosphodiesterase
MKVLRTFIACEIHADLQQAIQRAIQPLQGALEVGLVRWVPTQNVHLTLKFLGDVTTSSLEMIQRTMAAEAARCQVFDGTVEGLGAFPSLHRPSVLWIGFKAPPALGVLQHELDLATERLGYRSDERGFSPHLTVGRVRTTGRGADMHKVRDELAKLQIGSLGSVHVDAVHLFKSDLQAAGAVYTMLYTAPFGAAS